MSTPTEIVRLKITLDNVKPTVMRRIEVPVSITLDTLHEMIQAIMPWENYHMYAYYLRLTDDVRCGLPPPEEFDFGIDIRDAREATLASVLAAPMVTGAKGRAPRRPVRALSGACITAAG